jgi:hydroxymethylglutaryl-CoA reductase
MEMIRKIKECSKHQFNLRSTDNDGIRKIIEEMIENLQGTELIPLISKSFDINGRFIHFNCRI